MFVAPVLLDAAYDLSLRDLKDHWWPVATLTLIAVGVTVVSVALVIRLFLPDIPWAAAVALGAIVAPTDASAATAVLRVLRPSHRVLVILEGESLFNDASALLIYRAAVGVTASGTVTGQIPSLLLAGVASVFVGFALARLSLPIGLRIQELGPAILMQFLSVFLVWILADALLTIGLANLSRRRPGGGGSEAALHEGSLLTLAQRLTKPITAKLRRLPWLGAIARLSLGGLAAIVRSGRCRSNLRPALHRECDPFTR